MLSSENRIVAITCKTITMEDGKLMYSVGAVDKQDVAWRPLRTLFVHHQNELERGEPVDSMAIDDRKWAIEEIGRIIKKHNATIPVSEKIETIPL